MNHRPFIFFCVSLALLLTLGAAYFFEQKLPWKTIQRKTILKPEIKELILFDGKVRERCLTCHEGIEEISPSHPIRTFGCTLCHGGNGLALDKHLAHQNLLGGRNPSDFRVVRLTCGRRAPDGTLCHSGHPGIEKDPAETAPKSLMATMAGVIAGLRITWGAQETPDAIYASVGVKGPNRILQTIPVFQQEGLPKDDRGNTKAIDDLGNPISISGQYADDHWRKFCSRCHLYSQRPSGKNAHGGGCSSCHVLRNDTGHYEGKDQSISKSREGYGQIHRLTTSIPTSQCLRCHNRSGRIGLTFTGLMESDQYGTPYQNGKLNPLRLSDDRFVLPLTPDIHFEKGLQCIDCHTAREIMGDGRIHDRMAQAVEIRCRDCHGTENEFPKVYRVRSEKDPALWASSYIKVPPLKVGDALLATSRGGYLINVRKEPQGFFLYGKVDGKRHPLKIITKNPGPHILPGHSSRRMECFSCHSRWAPQCYGCHDYRKNGQRQWDSMTKRESPGRWQETRDYFRFEDPPLGINQRNKVSPFMPGCQVLTTILDPENHPLPGWDRVLHRRANFSGIVSGPINPHSIRKEVRSCPDCHNNPKALGLGSGILSLGRSWKDNKHLSPFIGEKAFPHSWESFAAPDGRPLQSISHPGARFFDQEDLTKILQVTPCLPCHDSYRDPIYQDIKKSYVLDRTPKHKGIVADYLSLTKGGAKPGRP